jgi:hypothetical protein
VVDALRPADLSAITDKLTGAQGPPPQQPDNIGATIIGQVQAMQKPLKEEDELVVLCTVGDQTLRIVEIFAPTWRVLVLTGIDVDKAVTRVITAPESLQLVCKPMPVQAGAKPVRVRFITPKPKPE